MGAAKCESQGTLAVMYTGKAELADGQMVEMVGSIMECANWADNIIRAQGGEVNINISEVK